MIENFNKRIYKLGRLLVKQSHGNQNKPIRETILSQLGILFIG